MPVVLAAADGLPTPLLRLRRVVVLNTGDTPAAREAAVFGDPLDLIWRRCVGAYLDQEAEVVRLLAGPVSSSTPEQRAGWLADAAALATAAAGPPASRLPPVPTPDLRPGSR